MIDFQWNKEVIDDVIDLTDCVELIVAFSDNGHDGRLTRANFIKELQDELLKDDLSILQNEQIDEFNLRFDEAIKLIDQRASWLGKIYPFKQENDEVYFAPDSSGKHHLSYLFLLACSSHNRIPSLRDTLRTQFENLCKEAMRALFPDWAEIFLFSKNSDDRKQIFGSSAKEAIPNLAKKLNTRVEPDADLPHTQKEYGIDLIAICSFDDNLEYSFFAFAQCTVAKEWWLKKHEARSRHALSGILRLDLDHTNFLLIPHFPRLNSQTWNESRPNTIDCIICDRYRICRLLEKSTTFTYQNLPIAMRDIFKEIQKYLPESR